MLTDGGLEQSLHFSVRPRIGEDDILLAVLLQCPSERLRGKRLACFRTNKSRVHTHLLEALLSQVCLVVDDQTFGDACSATASRVEELLERWICRSEGHASVARLDDQVDLLRLNHELHLAHRARHVAWRGSERKVVSLREAELERCYLPMYQVDGKVGNTNGGIGRRGGIDEQNEEGSQA